MWYGGLIASVATMVISLGLMACSTRQPSPTQEPVQGASSPKCKGIYVLAPEEYLLFMHGDDPVILASEGRMEDLPVYCTPEDALRAEAEMKAQKMLADGIWILYRLQGVWEKDVVSVALDQWRMRSPALLSPCTPQAVTTEYPASSITTPNNLQSSAAY